MAASGSGISLRGLVKTFHAPRGPVRAVRGIDVEIGVGETLALLGPNGAGKSTTIDMLLGLQRPDRGEVALFGASPEAVIAAGRVGAMLQVGELLRDVLVRELVEMMASVYPNPLGIDEVLALTGIEAIADQRTQRLSGGESQRVRFALALVADPELLVLDEPTVGMDVEGRRAFWQTMRGFAARGKTVIFATHYLEEADAYADRAVSDRQRRGRRRRPDDRDQGNGRRADDSCDAAERGPRRARPAAWGDRERPPRQGGHPHLLGFRPGDPGAP